MSKRPEALDPKSFTAFCFVVLAESESRGDVLDDEEFFALALAFADENEQRAESYGVRFRGCVSESPLKRPWTGSQVNSCKSRGRN